MKKNQQSELLAPAGNLDSALIAYKYGADAVYAGFSRFNAREMNKNFSFDDMSRLSEYSKKHNKKYYNTFNTLIKEDELELFYNDVEKAISLEPDALILQDMGIASLIKKAFPNQAIHTSTQMGVHNSAGVSEASKFGFERVILERQVTIDEIRAISKKSDMELEVFIHGALCCSLSGCCLFSSWIGGYSGNRGKCKQPCRRRYYPVDNSENGFFFSPADLAMIDKMEELIDIGVASFKIEGRLKRADYIANTVTAYRKMIDGVLEGRRKEVRGESRRILGETPGRVWSAGFAQKEDFATLIQYKKPGVAGKLSGRVVASESSGVKIEASAYLKPGDRVRFQSNSGEEQPSITIKHIRNQTRKDAHSLKPGDIGFIKTDLRPDANCRVFKVGSTMSVTGGDNSKLPLFSPSKKADLKIEIKPNSFDVTATVNNFNFPKFSYAIEFEESQKSQFDPSRVTTQFRATATDEWDESHITILCDSNPFIPASLLKKIRRAFWSWFLEQAEEHTQKFENSSPTTFNEHYNAIKTQFLTQYNSKESLSDLQYQTKTSTIRQNSSKGSRKAKGGTIIAISIADYEKKECDPSKTELILPQFCPETAIDNLEHSIKRAINRGYKRFRVTSLFQFSLIEKLPVADQKNLFLTVAFPLPATNSLAFFFLLNRVDRVQLWIELSKSEMKEIIQQLPQNSYEQFISGTLSILTTRAKIPYVGNIRDSKGLPFIIKKGEYGLFHLYSGKLFNVPPLESASTFQDHLVEPFEKKSTSTFNYNYKFV